MRLLSPSRISGHCTPWAKFLASFCFSLAAIGTITGQEPIPDSPSSRLSEESSLETLSVRRLNVRVALDRICKETGQSVSEARTWLEDRLLAKLAQLSPERLPTEQTNTPGQVEGIQLSPFGYGVKISEREATIVASRDKHRILQEWIRTIEEFGLRQVVIRTQVLRAPADIITTKLPIQWSHVETVSQLAKRELPAEAPTSSAKRPPVKVDVLTSKQLASQNAVATSDYLAYRELEQSDEFAKPANVVGASWTEAVSVIERSNPVLFTILNPDQTTTLREAIRSEETVKPIMSPSVVVFDGQVGAISNAVERPFVTGIEPVIKGSGASRSVHFQPKVRVYSEGTSIKLRPDLSGDRIRLSYELNLSKIREVQTFKMPRVDEGGEFSVQIPEVASTKFRTSQSMPVDYSLAVSTYETDELGNKTAILVLCQCSVLDLHEQAKSKTRK